MSDNWTPSGLSVRHSSVKQTAGRVGRSALNICSPASPLGNERHLPAGQRGAAPARAVRRTWASGHAASPPTAADVMRAGYRPQQRLQLQLSAPGTEFSAQRSPGRSRLGQLSESAGRCAAAGRQTAVRRTLCCRPARVRRTCRCLHGPRSARPPAR